MDETVGTAVGEAVRELTATQAGLLRGMTLLALLLVIVPLIVFAGGAFVRICSKRMTESKGTGRTLLKITVFSLLSVFLLRYSVGLYNTFIEAEGSLLWWEEISNSIVHALQTFSMDEDYTQYVLDGKKMMAELSGGSAAAVNGYSALMLTMNLVAPIAGGAMLFEILTSLFPKVKLFFAYRRYFNRKYYFSKLNERSLTLAISIMKAYKKKRNTLLSFRFKPIIIFCDVYIDRDNEKESELLTGAKSIGAICVSDDLIHISKNRFRNRSFVLIDDNEINNLKMFANLAEGKNADKLKYSEVFLFSQSDMHTVVESQVYKKLTEDLGFRDWQLPVVTPVKCYKNLVCNLLADIPLYEPLVEDKRHGRKLTLNAAILGSGIIGREMLLSMYWFGQILDCELNINVFSQETEEEFYEKLNYINPDIMKSTEPFGELLRVNDKGDCNPPYCSINYTQSNIDRAPFFDMKGTGTKCLNSDYIFVALGSDETNIEVANKLREEVGRYHLEEGCPTKTVITYVVYDSGMCAALNKNKCFDYSVTDNTPDIYMKAVGSLDSVYGVENVFCTNYEPWAVNTGELYDIVANKKGRKDEFNKKRKKDDYSQWADRSRAMHIKYKMFSAGLITTSVFDTGSTHDPRYTEALAEAYLKYADLAVKKTDERESFDSDLELIQRLSWLEHRRWIAFLRTKGFKSTENYKSYMAKTFNAQKEKAEHKHIPLKLHPCIAESVSYDPDITPTFFKSVADNTNTDGIEKVYAELRRRDPDRCHDRLDTVSFEVSRIKAELEHKSFFVLDYKQYDYPCYDIHSGTVKKMKDILRQRDERKKNEEK